MSHKTNIFWKRNKTTQVGVKYKIYSYYVVFKAWRLFNVPLGLTFKNSTCCSHCTFELFPCTILTDWFCVTEVDSVHCAVRTKSLCKTEEFRLYKVKFVVQWDLSTNAIHTFYDTVINLRNQ